MSDEAPTIEENVGGEQPKKKSKLPIILVLVLVLGGGGFFAMKIRGGKSKPDVKLSKEKPAELKEFLINLRDRGVYCRTEIAIGVAEGVKATLIDEHQAAVRDAINLRITSKTLAEVDSVSGMQQLKREIAADLNKVLADPVDEKKPDDATADGEPSKADASPPDAKNAKPAADKPAQPQHPEWDSDTGPVLKVYFNSFATQ